jgi:hypothetical protein
LGKHELIKRLSKKLADCTVQPHLRLGLACRTAAPHALNAYPANDRRLPRRLADPLA